MEVIVIESAAFKRLEYLIERAAGLNEKEDPIMSMEEVADYLRVEKQWVYTRRMKIGFFQDSKTILFRKSAVDKYFDSLSIKPNIKNKKLNNYL